MSGISEYPRPLTQSSLQFESTPLWRIAIVALICLRLSNVVEAFASNVGNSAVPNENVGDLLPLK